MREDAFPDPMPDLDDFAGQWEVDGDIRTVFPSPEGGLLATSDLTGAPINPAWVLSRGRRIPLDPPPGRG